MVVVVSILCLSVHLYFCPSMVYIIMLNRPQYLWICFIFGTVIDWDTMNHIDYLWALAIFTMSIGKNLYILQLQPGQRLLLLPMQISRVIFAFSKFSVSPGENIWYVYLCVLSHSYSITVMLCDCHDAANHWQLQCLFNRAFNKENIKALYYLSFVRAIYQWPVDSPHKGPMINISMAWCHYALNQRFIATLKPLI